MATPNQYLGVVHGAPAAAKHPQALDLFGQWAREHEDRRAFVRQDEIISYQNVLNAFIAKAEEAILHMKADRLGSLRYGDSIKAVQQLIEHAKHKRTFFDHTFAAIGKQNNTFGHHMTFDEQRMVPQTKDFGSIATKIREISTANAAMSELTPSQGWALVAANAKGRLNQDANFELAVQRLREFNQRWQTNYGTADLRATLDHMKTRTRIATQYRLEQAPGAQQLTAGGTPLYKLLMEGGFKNVWETGTSQASSDLSKRGAVEEQMGYGAAMRRTGGKAQDYNDASSTFDPKDLSQKSTRAEMPRYAATIGTAQESGVAARYGSSYIVWKEEVRRRCTWTPGDSWNMGGEGPQSVKNWVSVEYPEIIFAHADEQLLRQFMAEATGQDQAFLTKLRASHKDFVMGGAYIETQIHGDLTWSDVEEVVLDSKLNNLQQIRTDFDEFKRKKGFNFLIRTVAA